MQDRKQTIEPSAPYVQRHGNGSAAREIDYREAQKTLAFDGDLSAARALMTERDQLKQDVIVEVGLERLQFQQADQKWLREGNIAEEVKAIHERLAKDGLRGDPEFIRREAETNVERSEKLELAVIRRETHVQLERHHDRTLGHLRERPRGRVR